MTEFADLLQKYGGWGLSAILMLAVIRLYQDNQALSRGFVERIIAGLAAATAAAGGVEKALAELTRLMEASRETVGGHSNRLDVLVEKIQHGFGNTSAAMQAVANELQRLKDRDDRRQSDHDTRGRS